MFVHDSQPFELEGCFNGTSKPTPILFSMKVSLIEKVYVMYARI